MFTYCANNPVNIRDTSGYFWEWISDVANIASGVFTIAVGVALCTNPVGWLIGGLIALHGGQSIVAGIGNMAGVDLNGERWLFQQAFGDENGQLTYDIVDLGISTAGLASSFTGIAKADMYIMNGGVIRNLKYGWVEPMGYKFSKSKAIIMGTDAVLGTRSVRNDVLSILSSGLKATNGSIVGSGRVYTSMLY